MTRNATEFITPLTFESLTNHRCVVDTFDRNFPYDIHHISLATAADLILIAPATADVIAKLAHGIADDMLTTVVLAAKCKKLVAPAMNTAMLENPITQDNLKTLERYGFQIIPPDSGLLACQAVGSGKMPEPEVLLDHIARELARPKTLQGVRVTGDRPGPTQEALDPGALPHQPQLRPDGVCHRPGGHAPGGPRSPWSPAPPACPWSPSWTPGR